MKRVQTVIPRRVEVELESSTLGKCWRGLRRILPTITTKRAAYQRQADLFRRLGRVQTDLVLSRAYFDAAKVLEELSRN